VHLCPITALAGWTAGNLIFPFVRRCLFLLLLSRRYLINGFCGTKTTKLSQREQPESDDLAEFQAFHSLNAFLSAMSKHL
jgi:hypothetical protein